MATTIPSATPAATKAQLGTPKSAPGVDLGQRRALARVGPPSADGDGVDVTGGGLVVVEGDRPRDVEPGDEPGHRLVYGGEIGIDHGRDDRWQ
jgi:hypothetical protein